MAKPNVGSAQQPKTVQEWMEGELKSDAELRREVEETLNRMRIEQDLAQLRERRNVSQHQLAQMLGVKQPVIARIESGQGKNLELRTLIRIAAALGAKVQITILEDHHAPKGNGRQLTVMPARAHKVAGSR